MSGVAERQRAIRRHGYVEQASADRLPECPKCGAPKGDPCRTPSYRTTSPHAGRGLGTLSQLYLVGREIRNLEPEIDCYDPDDAEGAKFDAGRTFSDGSSTFERLTPAGSRGVIVEYREDEDAADVIFYETGAWIILTREEAMSDAYVLGDLIPRDQWPQQEGGES
jgi:hypothetical protein